MHRTADDTAHLPVELLAEIFLHSVPPYPTPTQLAGNDSPTRLGHVCSRWRSIVLSLPTLWAAFEIFPTGISFPESLPDCEEDMPGGDDDVSSLCSGRGSLLPDDSPCGEPPAVGRLHLAACWLERSRLRPVSILMAAVDVDLPADVIFATLKLLLRHCARWDNISLLFRKGDNPWTTHSMPSLRRLEVREAEGWGDLSKIMPTLTAPKLCYLAIHSLASDLKSLEYPWKNLTQLQLCHPDGDDMPNLLRQTTNLVYLRLICPDEELEYHTEDINLPHLRTLIIEADKYEGPMPDLLSLIRCPSLRHFYLNELFIGQNGVSKVVALATCISSFGCQDLQQLWVDQIGSNQQHRYTEEFAHIPRLILGTGPRLTLGPGDGLSGVTEEWGHWNCFSEE